MRYFILVLLNLWVALEIGAVKTVPEISDEKWGAFIAAVQQRPKTLKDVAHAKKFLKLGHFDIPKEELRAAEIRFFLQYAQEETLDNLEDVWRVNHPYYECVRLVSSSRVLISQAFAIARLANIFSLGGVMPSEMDLVPWRDFLLKKLMGIQETNINSDDKKELNTWRMYQRHARTYRGLILGDIAEQALHEAGDDKQQLFQDAWDAFMDAEKFSKSKNIALFKLGLLTLKEFTPNGWDEDFKAIQIQELWVSYNVEGGSSRASRKRSHAALEADETSLVYAAGPGTKRERYTPAAIFSKNLKQKIQGALARLAQNNFEEDAEETHGSGFSSRDDDADDADELNGSAEGRDRDQSSEADERTLEKSPRDFFQDSGTWSASSSEALFHEESSQKEVSSFAEQEEKNFSEEDVTRSEHGELEVEDISEDEVASFSFASQEEENFSEEDTSEEEVDSDMSLSNLSEKRKRGSHENEGRSEESSSKKIKEGPNKKIRSYIKSHLIELKKELSTLYQEGWTPGRLIKKIEEKSGATFSTFSQGSKAVLKILASEEIRPDAPSFANYLSENSGYFAKKISSWIKEKKRQGQEISTREIAERVAAEGSLERKITGQQLENVVQFLRKNKINNDTKKRTTVDILKEQGESVIKGLFTTFHTQFMADLSQKKHKKIDYIPLLTKKLELFSTQHSQGEDVKFTSEKASRHYIEKKLKAWRLELPGKHVQSEMTGFLKNQDNIEFIRTLMRDTIVPLWDSEEMTHGKVVTEFEKKVSEKMGHVYKFKGNKTTGANRLRVLYDQHIKKTGDGQYELKVLAPKYGKRKS